MSDFLDDVRDEVNEAVDNAAREVNDSARDVVGRGDSDPSTTSPAAQVTRLYDTVFDRAPDDAGLRFWTTALRNGTDLDDVAGLFVQSPEFRDTYGDVGQGEFVTLLYRNVLDREPDAAGQAFWTNALASGGADRDDVVLAFSESPEHVAKIGPVSEDPLL